jgi:hypothetical protein
LYAHVVDVAVLSILAGVRLGLEEEKLGWLTVGALFMMLDIYDFLETSFAERPVLLVKSNIFLKGIRSSASNFLNPVRLSRMSPVAL